MRCFHVVHGKPLNFYFHILVGLIHKRNRKNPDLTPSTCFGNVPHLAYQRISMKKIVVKPGERPVLLNLHAFEKGEIPISPVALNGAADQVVDLLGDTENEPSNLVWSTHAATDETLISLDVASPTPAGPAILLIGHDRPLFSSTILIGGIGTIATRQIADRVTFLIGDDLMISSLFKGKRRWRAEPANKYGTDAADILDFLNSENE